MSKTEEYRSRCNCPPCPTHAQCAKEAGELAFCVSKKSSCIKEMRVCFCPDCPVHKELGLKFMYYCIRGNEEDQKRKGPER
ncbi:MAG: DUF2769 domain-containing protein [Methanomassiliicoccus sp.]|nr:DUF2769 domain-containing protein [Methanomassiliicoccus sp.]